MEGGPDTINRQINARVRPHIRLDPNKSYRVRVAIFRRVAEPPGPWVNTLLTAETPSNTYKHFQSLFDDDVALNVISEIQVASWNRLYRIQTDPVRDSFRVSSTFFLQRYDNYAAPAPTSDTVTYRATIVMRDNEGTIIPLEQSTFDFQVNINTFVEGNALTPRNPASAVQQRNLDIRPVNQLPSHARNFNVTVSVSHFETPNLAIPTPGNSANTFTVKLMDFNGTLAFAGTTATFSSIDIPGPQAGDPLGPDFINTSLRINNQSGEWQGLTFGNGTELPVQLRDDGVATLTGGTLVFQGVGFPEEPGAIHYQLSSLIATPTTISGLLRLTLPSGLGIADNAETRVHEPYVWFGNTELTPQLTPVAATLTSPGVHWAAMETMPILFESSALHWDVGDERVRFTSTGEAVWVRADKTFTLEGDVTVTPEERVKPSNDGYFRNLNSVLTPEVVILPHPDNGSAMMTADFGIGDVFFFHHYPLGSSTIASSGSLRVVNNQIDTAYGGLVGAGAGIQSTVVYQRDCPDGNCGGEAGIESINFRPDDNVFRFTRDGGLHATGVIPSAHTLSWGWIANEGTFAHRAFAFDAGAFHSPGGRLLAADFGGVAPELAPARILLSGINPNLVGGSERPGTAAYKAGLGDYAGINLRVVDWGDQDAILVLAGDESDPFPLTNRAKYYVRLAGVTGIHEAVTGQFNPTAEIYGLDFQFTTLGWGFRDSDAIISRTAGNLHVKFPSDFGLDFEDLMITCTGALESATISDADVNTLKKLAYWNADFRPITLAFEGPESAACDPGNRLLVLGVEAYAGGIVTPLTGRIGFQTNGNLVTLGSGDLDAPFDSRFRLPNNFELKGPSGQTYTATPVGEAYLNDWAAAPDADFGWMNIAARLQVPFFSDLEVHMHTTAVKDDDDALYHIMGGYPNQGFREGSNHFFNQAIFDTGNRGFPKNATLAQYRNGFDAPNAEYRPVARKRWLGVVDLAYPLRWRPGSRSFVSFTDVANDFFVLSTEHRIDYMSADFIEITFGAEASLLPKINIANFVADKATDVTGVLQQRLATHVVDAGIQGLNDFLDVKQRDFFVLALEPAIDAFVDDVFDALIVEWQEATKSWANPFLSDVLHPPLFDDNTGLFARVSEGLSAARDVAGVLKEVDARLEQADTALQTLLAFIEEKDGQPIGEIQGTVLDLASLVSAALDKPEFAEKIQALMERAEPRVIEIRKVITEVQTHITEIRGALDENGPFADQVAAIVDAAAADIAELVPVIRGDMLAILAEIKPGVDSFPDMESQFRQRVKDRIHDRVLGIRVVAEINRLLKQQLYDTAARMTETIDEVFDQINLTLRDVIREVAGGLDDFFEEALGDISGNMATASVNGYAKVRNNSLTELRLDLKVKLSIPDDMKAHVYLTIRELSSENFPAECVNGEGKAKEVVLGAKDVAIEWLFPDTSASIHGKFILDGTHPAFPVRGMGGGFEIVGEINLGDSVIIREFGASAMFSAQEAYLSAAAHLDIQGFSGMGGVFFGRACSLDPFFWDETVALILGEAPFTGFYGYGEFWIPLQTLLGIPPSCMLNLSVGVGRGYGAFWEGPTAFAKMAIQGNGRVLCVADVTAQVSLAGLIRPTGIAFSGEGAAKGKVGLCPLCKKFDKQFRLWREVGGTWGYSFR